MPYDPEELSPGSPPAFEDASGDVWTPMNRHACTFAPHDFLGVMTNLIENPNLNSKWLFRADILYDDQAGPVPARTDQCDPPSTPDIRHFARERALVRTLVPRNSRRDAPLDQTCSFYRSEETETGVVKSLVLYSPHVAKLEELPFYHPKVRGIAHLHEWDPSTATGTISIHFLLFAGHPADDEKLKRIAYHLLELLNKHGHSRAAGYVKRVNHDVVVPRVAFQDRYSDLKNKYAAELVETWAETTDPSKHVFEDLGIAAFLIELWRDMYQDTAFPGFVDIGCGNGLLVYILIREGYTGWGFDARVRKSWAKYTLPSSMSRSGESLEQRLLLPSVVTRGSAEEDQIVSMDEIHDGTFPEGMFIVSNHADELTPWTPIIATMSNCPFIMIPCCSHKLTGEKYRHPEPRDKSKGRSAFASLVDWVTQIAEDCGWEVETEMLRIPSTRNTGLLGRRRNKDTNDIDMDSILYKYGGVSGYYENVAKLVKSGPRGH